MTCKRRIAAVLGVALAATFSTGFAAAERPGQSMAEVTARLAVASTHAAALEEALGRHAPQAMPIAPDTSVPVPGGHDLGAGTEGGGSPAVRSHNARKVTADVAGALDGLETSVREAQALAGGHPYLEPGIRHVLANAGLIRADGYLSPDALSLSHEISIELLAVANNARILEAESRLRAASTDLGRNRTDAFREHLEASVDVMSEAQAEGAYHLEDDIATLKVVLARLKDGSPARDSVTTEAMDELIGDINEHLADLSGE